VSLSKVTYDRYDSPHSYLAMTRLPISVHRVTLKSDKWRLRGLPLARFIGENVNAFCGAGTNGNAAVHLGR
jgi:hypothetical protein